MSLKKKNLWSLAAFVILATAVVYGRFLLPRWLTYNCLSIISWDVFGYYIYLPATFIHHDVGLKDFTWLQSILDTYKPTIGFYQAYVGPTGDYVMKYTMGLAILYSPFFFIAHLLAPVLGYPADGFSLPYEISISLGGLVYAIIGLWFLRKALLRYLPDRIAALTMAVIVLGTNYFQLTAYDGAMSHNYLFFLYALLFWFSIKWNEKPGWGYAAGLGLVLGMMALIRPTEIIAVLIPVCWGVFNKETLLKKWRLLLDHYGQVIVAGILLFLVGFMQLLYWKLHAGEWIYYSYEAGERIRLFAPYFMRVMFSFKKGWLIYTPLMAFAILGFIVHFRRNKESFVPIFLFTFLNLMIICGWTTWWFGGSLGQRSMMQSYALLALPMGFFIQWVSERKWFVRILFILVFGWGIFLNLFQTWQYMNFIFDPSRMTRPYYKAVFLKDHVDPEDYRLLEPEKNSDNVLESMGDGKDYHRRPLLSQGFEYPDQKELAYYVLSPVHSGKYAYKLDSTNQFSTGFKATADKVSSLSYYWIRATAWVYSSADSLDNLVDMVITVVHNGEHVKYRSLPLAGKGLIPDKWHQVTMDYEIPYLENPKDNQVQVYLWNHGKNEMFVDDMDVYVYEK
ncbi:MAG TPA: hypothetical protein PKJ28_02680 [Bacteroidales bacterium]|nr:hypothetical protein [Bacteroidales bacterium]HPS73130.1 hypothetical protein [Bacteroidales bacterium]